MTMMMTLMAIIRQLEKYAMEPAAVVVTAATAGSSSSRSSKAQTIQLTDAIYHQAHEGKGD